MIIIILIMVFTGVAGVLRQRARQRHRPRGAGAARQYKNHTNK